MKRFLIFTVLFSPLALVVYVIPFAYVEGVPEPGFVLYLMGFAYALAIVPGWVAAIADWLLSAKRFHFISTMVVGAGMAHLVAWYMGDPMYPQEIISVALTGAIPAAVCSWLSNTSSRLHPVEDNSTRQQERAATTEP
jgi:hypothetical protein